MSNGETKLMTDVRRALEQLRKQAKKRSFGINSYERMGAVRHGYLLALEEVEQALSLIAMTCPRDAA